MVRRKNQTRTGRSRCFPSSFWRISFYGFVDLFRVVFFRFLFAFRRPKKEQKLLANGLSGMFTSLRRVLSPGSKASFEAFWGGFLPGFYRVWVESRYFFRVYEPTKASAAFDGGFTGFYRVLIGCWSGWRICEFYWLLPSFIGFYLVLLGFTEFYLVLPGLNQF